MKIPGFESLTDDVKHQVRSIAASLSIDGTLRFTLRDAGGNDLIGASATNMSTWDECLNVIGPLLNRHGFGYKAWRTVPRMPDYRHAEVRLLEPGFDGRG